MYPFDEAYCLEQFENLLAIDSTTGQFRQIQDYQPSCSGWSPFPWNEKTAVHIRKATQIYTVI